MDTQYRPQQQYGIGLLATVTSLPSFHQHYTSPKTANEIPLDLSKKVVVAETPPPTPSPLKKRYREEFTFSESENEPNTKLPKTELTPNKPIIKSENNKKSSKASSQVREPKRTKISRKLKFDEDNSSPVSGTIIRPLEEIDGNLESGDIDPQYNIVEATDEARAEIATIPNVIGDYRCKLCRIDFEDVFELARHRCSCIVLLEYRCPECGKKFNCPANLASHRRWHKPRDQVAKKETGNEENQFPCDQCGKTFKRMAYLKKHQMTHQKAATAAAATTTTKTYSEDSKDSHYSTASSQATTTNNKLQIANINHNNNNVLYAYSTSSVRSSSSMSSDHQIVFNISAAVKQQRHISDDDDEDADSCDSSDSHRLQIDHRFTEDENIAAAALAHLRHGSSVIKHTTTALTV